MQSAPQSWEPPFCPNPKCRFHRGDTTLWRHKKIGFYFRRTPPYKIQRRRCVTCRRSFVASTFLPTYWLHRPELLVPVFHRLVSCSGVRQIATEFKASPETIARLAGRLGRHALLYHQLNRPQSVSEPLAADSFESYVEIVGQVSRTTATSGGTSGSIRSSERSRSGSPTPSSTSAAPPPWRP